MVKANRQNRRELLHDGWFWAALILGLLFCWLLALLMGRPQQWGQWEAQLEAQWRSLLWLSLLYPFVEEWLFRGRIQPWLFTRRYGSLACCGISTANAVTTVVFAGFHLFAHAPGWAALVLGPSLLYGWFRERYNSILPGVLLHSGYNFGYFSLFGLPDS